MFCLSVPFLRQGRQLSKNPAGPATKKDQGGGDGFAILKGMEETNNLLKIKSVAVINLLVGTGTLLSEGQSVVERDL